ncbi:MAG: PilZ domain-containing protein [Rhodoferax sp.]
MRKFSTTTFGKTHRSKRYRTELSTTVNGVSGLTHNVSTTGLYILQDQQCETGSRIDFWVDLDTPGGKLKLCCEGEVIRVDKVEQRFGIGIRILSQVMKTVI